MGRNRNKMLRKFILNNIEKFKDGNGRISWKPLLELVSDQFPEERITFDRIRSIYRNSNESEVEMLESKNYNEYEESEIEKTYGAEERDINKNSGVIKRNGDKLEATVITSKNPANLSINKIVTLFELDENKWECTGFTTKSWNTTMKQSDGHPMMARNYSVKATFKLKKKEVIKRDDLSWLFKEAREASLKNSNYRKLDNILPNYRSSKTGNTMVLALFDQHLGKLAWGEETGENYDIKIASKRFLQSAKHLIDRGVDVGFDKIIFPVGNDFLQFDGMNSETTRGTRVDSDIRWKKLFRLGVDLLREVLDYASQFADVDVILVQGNHDNMMSFYVFETLRGWYSTNPHVSIDKDIKTRTYRQVGVNLLGFTHGDKEKDNIYRIMQQEARGLWGKTLYAEWITGHYHKNFMDEKHGVTKRVVGSLTGTDAWHYESGYTGSLKSAQALIYNEKQLGPRAILYESINIKEEDEQR